MAKRYFFTLSFCPISELQNAYVWEVYGGNFSRTAIIFSIENDPKGWQNYHMAQVKYTDISPFVAYGDRVNAIEQANKGIHVWCDLSQLIGFHKNAKWSGEKEVRISTYYPYETLDEYLRYAKADYRLKQGRNRETYYIELPIWVDNESGWLKTPGKPELDRKQMLPAGYYENHPQIKIKKILVGNNSGLSMEEYTHLCNTLRETCRNRLGYDVEVDLNMFSL